MGVCVCVREREVMNRFDRRFGLDKQENAPRHRGDNVSVYEGTMENFDPHAWRVIRCCLLGLRVSLRLCSQHSRLLARGTQVVSMLLRLFPISRYLEDGQQKQERLRQAPR